VLQFSLNHMTVKALPYSELLGTAASLNCAGVEIRNDIAHALFDGNTAEKGREAAQQASLTIFALAEVKAFNHFTDDTKVQAIALMDMAVACGAKGIALIPRCDGQGTDSSERIPNLVNALTQLKPLLAKRALIGFVEPLGFVHSSLRFKAEAIQAIAMCDGQNEFQLVHDTFHHYLAGGGPVFPDSTGMVHISGVNDTSLAIEEINDSHRVLVDPQDRLGNIEQLQMLIDGGYTGPVSMEAFAPTVHALKNPLDALGKSFNHIVMSLKEKSCHVV